MMSSSPKPLDLSKCLNNSTNTYSDQSEATASKYGLSMSINQDKMSVTLNIDWATSSDFSPLILIIPIPPSPGAVAIAAIVSSINKYLTSYILNLIYIILHLIVALILTLYKINKNPYDL